MEKAKDQSVAGAMAPERVWLKIGHRNKGEMPEA
jgi:hypothetical protein